MNMLIEYTAPEWAKSMSNVPSHKISMAVAPTAIEPLQIPAHLLPKGCTTKIFVKRDDKTGCDIIHVTTLASMQIRVLVVPS